MVCPFCLNAKTNVYNSRKPTRLNVVWRRRHCSACGAQFTTHERAESSSILAIKDGGHIVKFSHAKLLVTLLAVCDHRKDLDESLVYLADTIEQKLYCIAAKNKTMSITKKEITTTAATILQNYDPIAYIKYMSNYASVDVSTIRQALKNSH